KEPVTGVLLIGKKADDKGEKLFARLADSKNVVKVAAKNVDRLSKVLENPAVLRNRELAQIDTAHVDAVDVQLDTHPAFKLRRTGDSAAGSPASQGAWKAFESGNVQDADNDWGQGLLHVRPANRRITEF